MMAYLIVLLLKHSKRYEGNTQGFFFCVQDNSVMYRRKCKLKQVKLADIMRTIVK